MKIEHLSKRAQKALLIAGAVIVSSSASAAIDLTPLTDATTDLVTLGGAAIALALTGFGLFALYNRTPRK